MGRRTLTEEQLAKTVRCPACMSPVGQACTAPTETSRRPVLWVHLARRDAALEEDRKSSSSSVGTS